MTVVNRFAVAETHQGDRFVSYVEGIAWKFKGAICYRLARLSDRCEKYEKIQLSVHSDAFLLGH